MKYKNLNELRCDLIGCTLCKRLVLYRESVPVRASFQDQTYWRKPVPGFGDPKAHLLILGLAPAAHGGNRTGRVLTGDKTADFFFKSLFLAGMCNQPFSISIDDGLILKGCYITAAVKCAPPLDKPTIDERNNCNRYLEEELRLLKKLNSVLVFGKFAFDAFLHHLRMNGCSTKGLKFEHGKKYEIENGLTLYMSYHPSPRNTNTGRLKQAMMTDLLKKIKKETGL